MGVKVYKEGSEGKILLWSCDVACNPAARALGIMFKKDFAPLLFVFGPSSERPLSIHSFFCPEFHAIFLDRRKRVVQIKKMMPSKVFTSAPASYMIEVGNAKGVKVGDKLFWR